MPEREKFHPSELSIVSREPQAEFRIQYGVERQSIPHVANENDLSEEEEAKIAQLRSRIYEPRNTGKVREVLYTLEQGTTLHTNELDWLCKNFQLSPNQKFTSDETRELASRVREEMKKSKGFFASMLAEFRSAPNLRQIAEALEVSAAIQKKHEFDES